MDFTLLYKIIFVSTFLAVSMTTGCSWTEGQMKQLKALPDSPSSPSVSAPEHNLAKDISILQTWSGDYPVAQLERLPEGQRQSSVGVIDDEVSFAAVWEAFKPGENVPEADFSKNLVVFTRNVDFYNRTNIVRVTLNNGMVEVLAMETRSALPIEDRAAMAFALIPRTGVKFIRVGEGQVDVRKALNPENCTYRIENTWVRLADGRAETLIAPGVASKTITKLSGQPVYGDLDGNGELDAVLLLVQQSGGSGAFFYLSAALNFNGSYQGTNAVFLGDRIAPQTIEIRAGRIVVLYSDRRPNEPMVDTPSVSKTKRLHIKDGLLEEIHSASEDGRLVQGWVTVGHEVRSFLPCREKAQRWLLGDSLALPEVMAVYQQASANLPPYAPLFMVLTGVSAPRPEDGFGNDYGAAFRADRLLEADPRGYCRNELIVVESPAPGERIAGLLKVTGKARGAWYFEGDFPLLLTDAAGQILGQGFATAQGPWMTKDWVSFTGTLNVPKPHAQGWGWLILKKDNPSDRPELDDEVAIPILLE